MLVNNVYGRYATFFKNHELKEADEYIKRVFPNAEFYIDYEHALVFERIGEDEEIDLDYHTVINGVAYHVAFTSNHKDLVEFYDEVEIKNDERGQQMIRLQNNYAITSSSGSFALVMFVKGKNKEGNEIDVQKPISYHTTLESALQSYSNNRMADLVSNFDMDLKDVKKAIDDLKREIKGYE